MVLMPARIAGLASVLAIAAVLAAVPGSAAAATEFEAGGYPATIKGENTTTFTITTSAGTVKCTSAPFSGEMAGNSAEMTLTPSFSGCTFAGLKATVSPGTCKFKMHVMTGASGDTGTIDITPPGCTGFQISDSLGLCTVTIPAQTGLSTITYAVDPGPPSSIVSTVNVSGISYTTTASCPGGGGSHTNGTSSVSERFKAFVSGVLDFFGIHH